MIPSGLRDAYRSGCGCDGWFCEPCLRGFYHHGRKRRGWVQFVLHRIVRHRTLPKTPKPYRVIVTHTRKYVNEKDDPAWQLGKLKELTVQLEIVEARREKTP